MIVALLACAPDPYFVEPPDNALGSSPFEVPSLAGCTYTQNSGSTVLTWEYDLEGRLKRDTVTGSNEWETTYTWEGRCLKEVVRSFMEPVYEQSSSSTYYRGVATMGTVASLQEENTFTCDSHKNWERWEHEQYTAEGSLISSAVFRFDNIYDSSGQLSKVQAWREATDQGPAATQLKVASFLWYDDRRPVEAVFQEPAEGGSNTATWIWDHDRLIGWDLRGSGSERAMTRTWVKDQLDTEVHTEEESEMYSFDYSYRDPSDAFPADVYITGSLPLQPGLPRPSTALELVGLEQLGGESPIEVRCKDGRR